MLSFAKEVKNWNMVILCRISEETNLADSLSISNFNPNECLWKIAKYEIKRLTSQDIKELKAFVFIISFNIDNFD